MKAVFPPAVHPPPRGFTLVEIMTVVVIIGVLAAVAIPAFMRIQRASKVTRLINDLRVFSQAFETYNMQYGLWPDNTTAAQIPTSPYSMNGDFKTTVWQGTTVIGGHFNWDNSLGSGGTCGVSVSNFTCDDTLLADIDTKIDDGNLNTGNFQKVSANRITLILDR